MDAKLKAVKLVALKLASDEQARALKLSRDIQELEQQKKDKMEVMKIVQVRSQRLSEFARNSDTGFGCPECFANGRASAKLTDNGSGLYKCRGGDFVFADPSIE